MSRWSWNPIRWLRYALLRAAGIDRLEAFRLSKVYVDLLNRSPPWVRIPGGNPLVGSREGGAGAQTMIEFVSRHAIAESGLWFTTVEQVQHLVCRFGDYTSICRGLLPETGEEVELVVFRYKDSRGSEAVKYLVASPDTEHGDHLYLDKVREEHGEDAYRALVAEMSRFVRLDPDQLLRERLGGDLSSDADGNPVAAGMDVVLLPEDAEPGDDPIPFVDDREAIPSILTAVQQYQDLTQTILGLQNDGGPMTPSLRKALAARDEVFGGMTASEKQEALEWLHDHALPLTTASPKEE